MGEDDDAERKLKPLFFSRKASNDESNNSNEKKMLVVNVGRCPQNHPCPSIRVCPTNALTQKGFRAPDVDQEKCVACGKCVRYCPMRALSLG